MSGPVEEPENVDYRKYQSNSLRFGLCPHLLDSFALSHCVVLEVLHDVTIEVTLVMVCDFPPANQKSEKWRTATS